MPLDKGKLQKLYSTLQQGGYSQSYAEFEKGFTGNDNYPNRKKVYDLLTEHGADIGNSYEDFMQKMYTPAASSPAPSSSQQRTQAPAPKPQPKPTPKPKSRPKPKGGGMTAAERAQFIRNAQGIVHQSAAGLQRAKNQMDYANSNRGLKVNPVHLGQNSKVVRRHANGMVAKPRPVFDVAPEQQPGDTYLTESGNEFTSRAEADTEQNAVDQYRYDQSETGQLNNAYAEAERLDQLLEQRGKEIDAENQDKWWRDLPRGGGGAVSTMNANDNNGRMTDTEYLNLLAARKKVDEQIRDLKAARDEKTGTFLGGLWRGFRDYAFDPSNWDNGYRDLLTTSAMLRAKTGAAQTPREKASERMMMEDTYKAGEAAQKAEKVLGNGYRFMRIGAQSLPFALQFMAGNATGMIDGLTRAGEGMGVKLARKIAIKQGANNMMRNIGRSVLKNTGVMLGDLGAATALTTTIQAGQTGADIGQRYVGDVAYDPKTDDYKLEGGKSLGRSIYEGVANSTIENYTEMLGEHLHLGKFASSALTKVGLGRVSNWFTKVGKTDFMQGVNKYMKMAGFNGYPQEVMEEEVGIPLHAVFDGGNKMSDLLDGRQQLDIVGGMLFSMAGMGGASMAMQGGHKAAMAVQYHQDQHKLDNADKVASFRLTADKWAPIKEEIDGTTNADFGKTMKNVLSNDELSDQEKQAVWDYAQRLIIMRGHNMGQEAATRNGMTDKETNTANESYTQGYNTTDATAMNDAKNTLAAAQQRLDGIFGENTDAQQILDAKNEDGSPYFTANDRKAAQDVVNAQQEYEGMLQRVRDDIDDEVQQTGAIYDSRTNDQGVIQSATLKEQNPDGTDKKVYITSGNVVMTDDGKSVDREKSDMSIVVVDDEGKVQMISPDEIFSLDAPLDGEQAKQQAIDAIKKSKAQEAADKINGKVDYTAGNTYTLTDSKGQQIEATLVADQQTGAVENQDGSVNVSMGGKVVPMAKETFQQMVDNTNMQRTAQGDEEAAAAQQPTEGADNAAAQQQPTEQADENGNVDASEEGSAVPSYPGSVVAPSEPHQWQMDDTFVIDNGGVPVRGQVTGIDADGVEIYTESPINGKKMQVISPEELQSMTTEINGETVQGQEDAAAAMQQPTQPVDGEQTGDNGSNGVNGEQPQGQAEPLSSQAEPQQTEGQQPQRAIDRIPSQQVDDGKGNVRTVHNWEQAEPGDTYDALTEIYHGNADRVKKGVQNRIGAIDKQIKATQKQMDAIDNSDDFDAVAAQGEKYDQLQQQKAALEQQKKYWQGVQNVPVSRRAEQDKRTEEEKAAAKAARQQAEQEAIEKARQERERVNGVPDVINDTPSDARQRGFRNVNGMVVNRQGNTEGVTGRESSVKFSSKDTAKGKVKVIEADQLQPSHVNGQRNPQFFIDEAQPKDRTDTVSSMAAAKIASNLNPEEITGDGSAYQFSAPTVNSRGEVIQGNNRSDALKLMYSTPAFKPAQDAYKQYIIDHASDFGFTPEDVAKIQQMQHPVMVNELGVDDDEAIRLGQMKASDNESGGIERIDPVTTSQKLGAKVGSYANILLSSPDEDASLSDVLMQNGAKTVHWLSSNGIISDTAAQSAFDKKGNLTPEARMDLQNILKQSLFQGGVSDLSTMFDKMPAKAQKAILSTFMRDFDSAESERILPEIQKAIEAWYDCAMSNEAFAKASNYKAAKAAMHDWTLQTNLLDDNMPSDKFSNFAMELACRLQGCSMREAQQSLNDFFDLVQGKSQGDLFGGTTMGEQADRQEAIRRVFDIDYKPINNKENGKTGSDAVADNGSQGGEGRQGSPADVKGRERAESGSGSADGGGRAESHDEEGEEIIEPKPVGHGRFGDIYSNFKGSFKDAVSFLKKKGSGYIRGMFHRDEIGDIDIVWGSAPTSYSGKGIAHIFRKHIETLGDFKDENEAIDVIEDTILHGVVTKQEGNTWAITKGDFQIVVTSDEDGNWVLTAFDKTHSAKDKKNKKDAAAIGTPSQPNVEAGAVAPNLSAAKVGNSSESDDKKSEKVAEGESHRVNEDKRIVSDKDFNVDDIDFEHNYVVIHQTMSRVFDSILRDGLHTAGGLIGTSVFGNKENIEDILNDEREGHGHKGSNGLIIMQFPKEWFNGRRIDLDDISMELSERFGPDAFLTVPPQFVTHAVVVDKDAGKSSSEEKSSAAESGARPAQGAATTTDEDSLRTGARPAQGAATTPDAGSLRTGEGTGEAQDKQSSSKKQEEPEKNNNSDHSIGATSSSEKRETERQGVNTEPSEKQKEAGNYKKGHIKVDGYDITIENPKGSTRSGKDASGKAWSVPMHYDYGYIKGTEGVDGDHIDVYLSDDPTKGNVYVVDQIDQQTGKFDEHKVMYGFPSKEAAVEAYKGQYEKGWKVGPVTEVSREDFKKWVESSRRKTKPFSEYKSVKEAAAMQQPTQQSGSLALERRGTEHEALPTLKEPAVYKNNLAGGDAHVNIEGNPKSGYEVRYYDNKQEADINYPLAIGTEHMTAEQLADHLQKGDFTIAEQPTEPSTPTGTNGSHGVNGNKGQEKQSKAKGSKAKQKAETKKQEPKVEPKKANAGQFGLVSDERMEELKKRLRAKLNNLNMGVDPEVLAIGLELTAGYIDRGVKKFADYSKAMINDLGDVVRPYLKAFYNGVRDMPEITSNGLDAEMDDYETVSKFNVATIGKEGEEVRPSILDTAEQVSNESHVERAASNVSDEDVKSEQKKLKGEKKTSGLHEVDTDRLFKDLKAGKTVVLNDYYKDEDMSKGMDLMIEEAHDKFLSKLNTFKEKPTREMLEKALKDREQWIDELADMFKKGETEGVVNGKYQKKVDVAGSLAIMLGERKAIQELLGMDLNGGSTAQQRPTELSTSAERTEQNPSEHGTTETDTSVADSKRKQFDLFVRWDLERFIGKSKAKRVTIDWEHSEPENDYLPMKIDGEPSFVGVTEQDGEGDEIDRPIAIYDIAEGGDFPDVPKTAEFEAYAKDYNAENNLTEDSDDYATMDANNPYVAFRSVDAAVKFNDWLHEKEKGAAAEQRRTEPSEKKENTRYSERGFTLRPATEEDVENNRTIYVDGKRTHIVMVVRKGEQVGAAQFSKPVIEAVYTTDNERVPLSKIEVEDIPTTVHLKTAGDFYEAYGNDAVALGEVTGVSVVTRKDGTRMAGFPKKMLDEYEQGLRNNGWDVSVDGKATKKATENILQQLQSAPKAKTSTNAIKNALRGKKTSSKENNEKKKAVSSQQEPSLFDDLFGGEEAAAMQQPTEQKATEQTPEQGTAEQKPAVITTDDEKGKEKPVETKPEKELTGDSKEYQARAKAEQEFVERIKGMITDAAKSGESLTMSDIKKAYKDELDGNWELKDDYSDTDLQELVERAMTLATREVAIGAISKNTSEAVREGYDKVVKLYESQPSLNARDSTRVAHQQYSTPTPFGYVMDWFLRNGRNPYKGLEPSAGNGALTIGFPAALWHVNDIDERRLMNLRTMPYGKITNQDGTMPFEPKAYNMVATNPPFGSTQEKEFDGGRTKISSLEGLMAINALASMKDDGRAAIIIGGNTQYMSNGAMQAKDMKLFKHLYTHYNVVDVINLDGDMYKRNGTGYNVRMILIAGRKTDVGENPEKFTFPPVKKKARAEQVKTFDELYKRVEDDIQQAKQMEREPSAAVNSDGSQPVNSASERTGNREAAGGVQQQPVRAGEMERRTQSGRTVRPSSAQDGRGNGERGQHGSADRLDNADGRDAGSNHAVSGNRPSQGQSAERREGGSTGRGTVGGTERGRTAQRNNTTGERPAVEKGAAAMQQPTQPATPKQQPEPRKPREKVALGQEKVAYPAKSQSMTLQSRVPAAQAEAIAENLDKLGDVDEMVRSELGYSSKDELYSHLAAEQIDSVALAINQMKQGKGFIIGDMTGVGKGRQGAALIRWAIKQGKTPIYFTQKARLYTDNYRDMCDIGSKGLHPFLIASNDDGNIVENVVDENGEKVYDKNGEPVTRVVYGLPKPKERERVYDYILQNGKLPPEYDYVLVTYSQIQSGTKIYEIGKNGEIEVKDKKYKGKTPGADKNGDIRRDVLEKLAKDNYVFLDESHTVGGQSSSGLYMQDMLKGAEGVTYLSATFAKRPDNMPLYAMKTAMSESGLSQKDMIDAIQNGGVTLQEIMSKQLVQSGQMIRRERDFSGVSIDWEGVDEETDKQQRAQFDEVAKIFNAIREFQDNYVDPSIEKMSEDMAEEGKFSKKTQGTSHMGVNNVPFASKMYNLVNQLLFSLKANAVADKAIECLKKGEKPVISFNNTMEGFLDDMPRNTPMKELPNFSLTLMRALEGTLRYTEGEVGNKDNQVNKTLNISDLGDEAVAKYNEIRKTILNLSIGLPIDPMDAIKMRIEAAGYKVGEITGRKSEMVMDADGNYIVQSRTSKEMDGKAAASAFNSASGKNGGLDVLLINKSGSTGISLHASSKFTDQSPRVMIAAQFQSDINDEVQMRGRIDRTGQVHRGRYIYLVSSIPAEQRLQMMFKNKLKSLDANTTSSQKSKFNEMEVTDFMNKYGDIVTEDYMMEHPDLEERLGDPLDMLSDESKKSNRRGGDEENNPNSGCAGKILRRLPFLSVKEQEQIFNDLAEAYKVKMQILNDAGENDLEITTMPLRAETKSRKVWKEGSDPDSDNAFADNTYIETAEVDVLKKPMKAKEVREYADRLTDGKPWEQWHQEQHEAVEQFYADKAKAVEEKAKAEAQKRIDKAREDYIKGCLKARKKGDNNWSDEEISHMADIAAKEAADKEQTKINNRYISIDAQRNDVLGALDAFTPLEPLIIPLNLKDTSTTIIPSLGTFLGIKFGKGYSRSSSTAVFATLDGRRKIEVPLSDKISLENIKHQSVMLGYQARGLNMDNWDSKVPTKSRKTAYIVTGNLMQALVDTQKSPETKGQLISYTTIDGDVKQGILMNDRFKEENLKTSVPISSMLQKLMEGEAVESADKEVKIERGMSYHYNDFKLSVPKSKSRGGKYFLDKKLLRLLEDEFTTSGSNMTAWVSQQNLKKVLDYLSKALGVTVQVKANLEEADNSPRNDEPSTPSEAEEGNTRQREGNGAYSDEELSLINDPVAKWLGKSNRTKAQQKAFANRERKSMESTVKELADRLHLDNVNIVMDASTLDGRKARAKGFYDRNTNEITIVIPNHRDVEDVMQTLLHEGVAHYGLRKMFGSHFDTFLDNVYAAADNDVRRRITDLALKKYGGDFRVATEEYLASLAEQTDFEHIAETFWQKIKDFFLDMLHAIGFADFADKYDFTLSDNELRYILWRSYENLKEPGRYRSILGEAEDVAKQAELQVGDYSEAAAEPLQTERLTQKEREQKPNPAAMYGSARNSDYAAANDGVREPEAWGKRDMLSRAEQVSHGIDPDLLFRDTIEDDDNTARETYNRMADEAKSRIREAWQDSMINVRNLQQAVLEQRGEKLEDYEDAYNAENRSHGKSRAESEYFTDNLYKPLLKAVDDVAKSAKVSVGDVTEYMMAKHGLERNIVFAQRDAEAAYKKAYDEAKQKYDALMNASRAESDPKKADALEKAANKVKFPDYDDIFNHLRMRDYAGLTSLTGQSDVQDAEAEAQRIVNDMESRVASIYGGAQDDPVSKLWKATNAATKWTLKKGYESGIISKDNYNYVSGMFNYYVPLRGWQEDTAGDLFDYVGSGDKGTAFSPTLHKAKGRRSEADNPIAYIGSMAVSAIVQGNKNKVKQTFLGFVENHPTNLVTVSEMWYRNFGTDTDPDWREDVPNIPEDATADEVADIVQQHEDMMEQLKDLDKATKQRGRLHLGVPVKKGQALEHHVEVMVNGKKYVLYINGNPRAAQALNGTRQRRASEHSFESSKIARMGRLLAERYTSLSPSFTVSNALRDLTMAAITTLIKESPAYAMRFRLNVLKLGGPARVFTLMKWYKKAAAQQQPTGQMSETQKYFYEFMTEGAETGFTSLKEIDEYKKDMDKMYSNMNQKLLNPKRLFRGLSQGLEYANRCIEDMTRFAIYMASRQSGRNVKRSVNDAKNITLNFNRKGSGEMGNSTYRNLQIFVNPAIQSLQNVGKMAKDHPARFTLLTGSIALIGAAQVFATQLLWSVFGGGDGDDDDWNAVDEYWKLPSWQRRNNLVMWIPGTKKFAMIPLAQEFRVFHGFGETMTTVMEGKSGENPALEVLTQASDLLPLDFAGNNGNPLVNLAPTVTQPLLQVGFNTDFTGRPLYKDNDFNKYEPSFQKAYVGTPSWLIKSSEFINDITGGDDHMQGWWERTTVGKELNNPAVVDHILKGYYGGMYSFLAQLGGTMYTLGTGNMPDAQEVPVVNRVITAPRETEQGGKQKLPDWYYDLSEENARQQNEFSGYKKDYMKGDADGQKKFNELIKDKDFQKWQKVNTYIGAVQQIRTAMNYTKDPNEKVELQKNLDEVLGELKKMKDE